jgi:hypothetical protein
VAAPTRGWVCRQPVCRAPAELFQLHSAIAWHVVASVNFSQVKVACTAAVRVYCLDQVDLGTPKCRMQLTKAGTQVFHPSYLFWVCSCWVQCGVKFGPSYDQGSISTAHPWKPIDSPPALSVNVVACCSLEQFTEAIVTTLSTLECSSCAYVRIPVPSQPIEATSELWLSAAVLLLCV